MNIIIKHKGEGKTLEGVNWVKEGRTRGMVDTSERVLVVASQKRKDYIMQNFGLGYHEVETVNTIIHEYCRPTLEQKELFIDDLDSILQNLFYGKIKAVSFTI